MSITFVDPRGVVGRRVEPYQLATEIRPGDTIGLFANGFPDSVTFLEHIGTALQKELPGLEVALWNKGNASALATDDDLDEIAQRCVAVVAAYGH